MKKYIKMCVSIFKILKKLLEMGYQIYRNFTVFLFNRPELHYLFIFYYYIFLVMIVLSSYKYIGSNQLCYLIFVSWIYIYIYIYIHFDFENSYIIKR